MTAAAIQKILSTLLLVLLAHTVWGQNLSEEKEKTSPQHILKLSAYPLLLAYKRQYFIQFQYERTSAKVRRLSYVTAFHYSNYAFRTFVYNTPVFGMRYYGYRLKFGPRYYFTRTPDGLGGFFVSLLPFYSRDTDEFEREKRHSLGLDAMTGYQRLFKRWSVEANISYGHAGSWYRYASVVWRDPPTGFDQRVFIGLQLNVGYLW